MAFVPDTEQAPRFVPDQPKQPTGYAGPVVEENPVWTSTGGGAAVGRPRMVNRTNVQATPRPLESFGAGVTKSVIDPLVAGAQLATGGRLGTSDLAQRLDKEADVYYEANPVSYGAGRVGGAVLPAAGVTKAIGAIPSFARANPIVQGGVLGATSGVMTPINTGQTGAELYGEAAKNVALGTAIGGAIPAVGAIPSMFRGQPQTSQMQQAIQQARDLGYVIPPTQANPTMLNRMMEGIAGKVSTAQNASARNQEITNKLAAKSLGLPEDAIITPQALSDLRSKAGQAYENLGLSGRIKTSPKFNEALDKIAADAVQAQKDFPTAGKNEIVELVNSLKSPSFDVSSAISKIRLLRNDADKAYRMGDKALGKANRDASQVLENTIENFLANTKQTDLLDKFRDARQLIAKTYTIEKAANTTTGTIDAKKLAAQLQKGKPLSGELKSIAEFSQAFPKAAQVTETMGSLPQISPFDVLLGLLGGVGTGGAGAGAVFARPALRAAALSEPVQNRLIQSAAQPYLNEQQRNLARLLTLQGIQGAVNEQKRVRRI